MTLASTIKQSVYDASRLYDATINQSLYDASVYH